MAVFVNDTFTDADGTVLTSHVGETGATWSVHPNADAGSKMVIGTNRLRSNGAASSVPIYYASGVPAGADYDVHGTFRQLDTTASVVGIYGRMSTSAWTGYRIAASSFGGSWVMSKFVASAQTDFGTYAGDFGTATDYDVKLEMRGTAIKAYFEGTSQISATDSAITAAGQVGVNGFDTYLITQGWQLGDITGTDLSSATASIAWIGAAG